MSAERNYRVYVQKYHKAIDDKGNVDLGAIVKALGLDKLKVIDLGEARTRAKISQKIGAVEEHAHGTFKQKDGSRVNEVPADTSPHHNRLVNELYTLIAPPEPPVTEADTVAEED